MASNNDYTLSVPTLAVDNIVVPVKPNSVSYTEGLGEQQVRAQSAGGGSVSPVVSRDVTTNISQINVALENTKANIETMRKIKANSNFHVVTITDLETGFTRTMQKAILTSNYTVGLGADTQLDIIFMGAPVV